MKLYELHNKQVVNTDLKNAWEFLSNPKNLQLITPEHMGFEIVLGADRPMFQGQIIQYKVCPFPGIKTNWVTEITHVKQEEFFVDEQRIGPYKMWHHKHFVKEVDGGVEMEDLIHYIVPMGILGQIVHPFIVRKKLIKIFEYRREKLKEIFN